MGKMYHGSPKKLESIDPQDRYAYSDEEPVVFATPDRTHAISYIAPWSDDDFVHKTVSGDPALHMEEQYPGAFEKLYKGRKGYLYELDPSSFSKHRGEEFTSKESPEILSSEEIDLYEAMLAEEAAGRLKLKRAIQKTASEQDFSPDFTPEQLKELGVYDQVYGDMPSEASMKEWPEHWINKQDPLGWLQWYDRYSEGRRTDDDSRQIKRWKSFKARHLAQYLKNPTPRRAAALRNWGIDVSNQEKLAELIKESKGRLAKNINAFVDGLIRQGTPIKDINVAKHLKLNPQVAAEQKILREAELIARRRLMQTHNVAAKEVEHLAGTGGGSERIRNLRDFQGARNEAETSIDRLLEFQKPGRGVNHLIKQRAQEIEAAEQHMLGRLKWLKRDLADKRNEGMTLREIRNMYFAKGKGHLFKPREGEGVIRGGKLVRPGQSAPAPAPVATSPVATVSTPPVATPPVATPPVATPPVASVPVSESSNKLRNALIGTSVVGVPAAAYAFPYEEPTALEKALATIENMSKTAAKGTATKRDPKKWSAAKSRAKAKMGGKWSARAAQLAVKYYKDSGGTYSGKKPTKNNNKLKKWTKEEWGYRPGSKAEKDSKKSPSSGTKGRYLPKKKWQSLSKSEQKATDAKKKKGMKKGKGVVSNTAKAKYDSKKDYTKKSALLDSIQTMQYPEKVAPQFQGYISQKRTILTTPISDLPQPPHPTNDSRETRNELIIVKKHMEEGRLPESLMILADRAPEKIFEIACKRFGVEPKSKQASIIKEDFNKIAFDLKYIFKRPRPWSLAEYHGVNLNVTIPESADTPSYPSGHAMMGYGLAEFYKSHYPEYSHQWDKIADIIQHSRLQAGLHFPSDNAYAKQIVDFVSEREKVASLIKQARGWNLVSKVRGGASRLRDAVTRRKAPAAPNPAQAETQVVKSTQPAAAETQVVQQTNPQVVQQTNPQVVQQTNPQVVQQTTQQTTQAASPTYAQQWQEFYANARANPYSLLLSPTLRGTAFGAGGAYFEADQNRGQAALMGALFGAGVGRVAPGVLRHAGGYLKKNLASKGTEQAASSGGFFSRLNPANMAKRKAQDGVEKGKSIIQQQLEPDSFVSRYGIPIGTGLAGLGVGTIVGRAYERDSSPLAHTTNNIINIDSEALSKLIQSTGASVARAGREVLASAIEKRGSADYRPRGTLMLTDGKGNVLAGSASSKPGQEATSPYYFPGGGVFEEEGVDRRPTAQELEEGIRREALEELGYSIKNYRQLKEEPTQLDMPEWWKERQWKKRGVGYKGLAEYFAAGEVDKEDRSLYNVEGDAFDGGWHSIEDVATALEGVSKDNPYYENNLEEARLLRSLQQKTAKDDHVELRRKERANHISKKRISKIREAIKETQQSLPKGTHHVKLDNASAVIKDVGDKHVLATLLAANMYPPGDDLSSAILKTRRK